MADLAWAARAAELRSLLAAGPDVGDPGAVRELLALQSSDWAFLASSHPRMCATTRASAPTAHLAALDAALASPGTTEPDLRALAPFADPAMLLVP